LTVELDSQRAAAARELFVGSRSVEVMTGDWSVALERGPFDLLFSDGGPKRNPGDPEKLLPLLRTGALLVLDDYTPNFGPDPTRDIWLDSHLYRAQEVQLSGDACVILAVKC